MKTFCTPNLGCRDKIDIQLCISLSKLQLIISGKQNTNLKSYLRALLFKLHQIMSS